MTDCLTIPEHDIDLQILQSLRRIIRAVDIQSRQLVHAHKITGPQLWCLLALKDAGPLTASELARRIYVSPSTVVGIGDRLEASGLIRRERSSTDRRKVVVSITVEGLALAARAPSPLQTVLQEALQDLSELERVSISLALQKIVDLMEASRIDASPVLTTGPLHVEPTPP